MFDSFPGFLLMMVIVYISAGTEQVAVKNKRQAPRSFNSCGQPKTISFMLTWGPSSKTTALLDAFKARNQQATLMVNPNMLNEQNKATVNTAFSLSQIVGMQVPLLPEDLAAMSAKEFATYLKQYADKIAVAMNFAGQWPKYITMPFITKDICLVDLTQAIQIANQMGFVVVQNTKGNGEIQKTDDISIMNSWLGDGSGIIYTIEDSDTNSLDGNAVTQVLNSVASSGYKVTQIRDCVGLSSESTLKSTNAIPAGLSISPGFFKLPSVCINPATGATSSGGTYQAPNSYASNVEVGVAVYLMMLFNCN